MNLINFQLSQSISQASLKKQSMYFLKVGWILLLLNVVNIPFLYSQCTTSTIVNNLINPISSWGDGNGGLFVTELGNNKVIKVDLNNNNTIEDVVTGLSDPSGIWGNGNGHLFVSERVSKKVIKIDLNNNNTIEDIATGLVDPTGLWGDGNGHLFLAEADGNKVIKIDLNNNNTTEDIATGLTAPYGIWGDGNGNLYLTEAGASKVTKIDLNNNNQTQDVVTGLSFPYGIWGDGHGHLFINENTAGKVTKIDLNNNNTTEEIASGLFLPYGIWGDGNGNLFVPGATIVSKIACPPTSSNCTISDISITNNSNCIEGAIYSTFTTDVTVTFADAPNIGTLQLTGDGTTNVDVSMLTSTTSHTFIGVTMTADGGTIDLTATFSDDVNCTLNNSNAGTAPVDCTCANLQVTEIANNFSGSTYLWNDGNGNLFTTEFDGGKVSKIDLNNNNTVSDIATGLNHLIGIWGDGNGHLYVVQFTDGKVSKIDLNNNNTVSDIATNLGRTAGIWGDGSGNLFVSEIDGNRIIKIELNNNNTVSDIAIGLVAPEGVWGDGNGHLFITEADGKVVKIDLNNNSMTEDIATGLNDPTGIWGDGNGHLFVSESNSDNIQKINLNNNNMMEELVNGLFLPDGIWGDGSGNLFVTELNGKVSKIECVSTSCNISAITTSNLSTCITNGTSSNFTTDITITFANAPSMGTLELTGDGTASVDVSMLDGTTSHTFTGVTMTADGGAIDLTATFSDNATCTFNNTDAGTAPGNCTCNSVTTDIATAINSPSGIWGDNNGNLFVIQAFNDKAIKIDLNNNNQTEDIANGLGRPEGIWGDGNGNLYITEDTGNKVTKIDLNNNNQTEDVTTGLSLPYGIWGDGNGNLYITESTGNKVTKIDLNNNNQTEDIVTGLTGPYGIWGDGNSNLYVVLSDKVIKIDLNNSNVVEDIVTGVNNSRGIWGDSNGNLYVAEYGNDKISKIDLNNNNQIEDIVTGVSNPIGIWGDGNGNFYITEFSGQKVSKIECTTTNCMVSAISAGNISTCVTGATFTTDITITFADAPSMGTLNLSGDGTASVDVSMLDGATSHTFTGVTMTADGGAIDLTATFSDDAACMLNNPMVGTAPGTCTCANINTTELANNLSNPYALWNDGNGNLFFTEYSSSKLIKIDLNNNNMVEDAVTGLGGATGIWGDGNGNLFVSHDDKVTKVDLNNNNMTEVITTGLGEAVGIWGDGSGHLFVNEKLGEVIKIDLNNNNMTEVIATGLGEIGDAWGDGSGNLFIAVWENDKVIKIDLNNNNTIEDIATGLGGPQSIWGDSNGNLFVASYSTYNIIKIDLNNNNTKEDFVTGLNSPSGISGDNNGSLFVTTQANNGNVIKIECANTNTNCMVSAITTSNLSTCITNGTSSNFTADITITFGNAPSTGTLDLTGDGTASVAVSMLGSATSHTFTGVTMTADGSDIDLTATFSDDATCSFNNPTAGTAPMDCTTSCPISAITTSNFSICMTNGTHSFFTADVTITFGNVPSTGTLDMVSEHTGYSVDVSMLSSATSHTFTGIRMTADGSDIELTASFSDDATCSFNNPTAGTAPMDCTTSCPLSAIATSNLSACMTNGTNSFFTADVTITFGNVPSTGTLDLTGDGIASVDVSMLSSATSHTFTGVTMAADASDIELMATFSDDATCSFNNYNAGTAPGICICMNTEIATNLANSYYLWNDGNGNLFLAKHSTNKILKIDLNNNNVIEDILTGLGSPLGIWGDGSGNLFVSLYEKVIKIDLNNNNAVSEIATGLDRPGGIWGDGNGNLFLNDDGGQVIKIDLNNNNAVSEIATGLGELGGLWGDTNGNLFIAAWDLNKVIKIDLNNNNAMEDISTVPGGVSDVWGDGNGHLFVVESFSGNILKIDLNNNNMTEYLANGLDNPLGISGDSNGDLFVTTEANNGNVFKLDCPSTNANCMISDISTTNLSTCIEGIVLSTFTTDVTVTFVDAPSTGTLQLSGDGSASVDVSMLSGATAHTFTGVTMTADGGAIDLTATFSADATCTFNNSTVGTAPVACICTSTATTDVATNLAEPRYLWNDGNGHLFVIEYNNDKVIKIDLNNNNVIEDIATGLNTPSGIWGDSNGHLFVSSNGKVIKIDLNNNNTMENVVTGLTSPDGIWGDDNGNLYVSEYIENKVLKIDLNNNNMLEEIAVNIQLPTSIWGDNNGMLFLTGVTDVGEILTIDLNNNNMIGYVGVNLNPNSPLDLWGDNDGHLFISDLFDGKILKIDLSNQNVTDIATGLSSLSSISGDPSGNLYTTDNNKVIEIKCFSCGENTVSTFAGSSQGNMDGNGVSAQFNSPFGLAIDPSGNIIIADSGNNRIRKIDSNGEVTTIAGGAQGYMDGNGTAAQFNYPSSVAIDLLGNIIVADRGNARIRKIDNNGDVTTVAGSSTTGNMDGNGTAAQFFGPTGVAVDPSGNIIVADYGNHRIRKINNNGDVTTIAGSIEGYMDGNSTAALFKSPAGVIVDNGGNIIVADAENNRIRKIDINGDVTTIAGSTSGYMDGNGMAAQFNKPSGLAFDQAGNIIVADYFNSRIRKIDSNDEVTTIAGSTFGYVDGDGTAAQFRYAPGVAVDQSGNIFVVDLDNHRVRKIEVNTPCPTPPFMLNLSGPSSVTEGTGSNTNMTFTITRSGSTVGTASVDLILKPHSADPVSAADFGGTPFQAQTVNFADGESTKNVIIEIAGDSDSEKIEQFAAIIKNISTGGAYVNSLLFSKIIDDDSPVIGIAGYDILSSCSTTVALEIDDYNNVTGIWSIISGTGGSFANPNNAFTSFTGQAGETYVLRWNDLTQSDEIRVSFVTDSDNDGVNDCDDRCPFFNDNIDSDMDGAPDPCDCEPNNANDALLILPDGTMVGGVIPTGMYQSSGVLESTGFVATGSDVIHKAGFAIELNADFEVELGAEFYAYIGVCTYQSDFMPPVIPLVSDETENRATEAELNAHLSQDLHLRAFPNPSQGFVQIGYELSTDTPVSIEIFNTMGSRVDMPLKAAKRPAGKHLHGIDVGALSAGIYYVHVRTNTAEGVQKIVVQP